MKDWFNNYFVPTLHLPHLKRSLKVKTLCEIFQVVVNVFSSFLGLV
jgi:hypothetical protein